MNGQIYVLVFFLLLNLGKSQPKLSFDLGLGLYYRMKELYIGYSVTHLNQATAVYGNNDDIIMDADKYRIRNSNGSTEYIRILSNGNVGFGTDVMDSSANLSITDTGSARIYMKSGDSADCSLIFGSFNDTATGDPAVCAVAFGGDKTVSSGTFTIQFPTADASNAIVRIA